METDLPIDQNTDNRELQRVHRDLSILYEVSNAMRTTLDLKHILYIILTGVTSHTGLGFNRGILFLVNPIERCLEPQMAIGPESLEHAQRIWEYISRSKQDLDDLIQEEKLDQNIGQNALFETVARLKIPLNSADDNLLIKAFTSGLPMHITEEQISSYTNDPFLQIFQTKELVIMPLKVKDQVNGLIIADNLFTQKPISEDDFRIFTMLSIQAGLAIENSRLYEMIKHKSHTDSLTGLWNHGFFQDKLSEEVDKSIQSQQAICLMMIDIDDFKKLNDRHGHQNGDIVLKEIAQILQDSSREGDYVCRYGGEEFSIILTQTNIERGYTIAERIRQRIAEHQFPKFSSQDCLTVTVSIGLTVFPGADIATKENLIALADKTMYTAKLSGKNQTCCA